jgi:uncharacterized Zn finger protein (UPF0148 family)
MAADDGKILGTVRCSCGVKVSVPADGVGRSHTCPGCAAAFKVVWAVDPKTREKILARTTENAIRIPAGSHQLVCVCGQPLVARKDQAGKKVKCPVCGAPITIERYKDPTTMETKVRRSDNAVPLPVVNATPSPVTNETTYVAAKSLGRTTRRRKAPEGALDILCQCGEYLRVFLEHLEKKVMCPSCGTLMKLEKSEDSQTKVRPRIIGQGTPPPPPADPDDWSMEDFKT